jgi:hypothetical protein
LYRASKKEGRLKHGLRQKNARYKLHLDYGFVQKFPFLFLLALIAFLKELFPHPLEGFSEWK